ncbi:MAG: hypothetical protein A2X94_04945 [Bdellovibrionales bacterium GWB1_55_8]|nr:MAG: hypothetical protein A2X94_04945 [Bdellovibrionales bacterium GWB1_55_8]
MKSKTLFLIPILASTMLGTSALAGEPITRAGVTGISGKNSAAGVMGLHAGSRNGSVDFHWGAGKTGDTIEGYWLGALNGATDRIDNPGDVSFDVGLRSEGNIVTELVTMEAGARVRTNEDGHVRILGTFGGLTEPKDKITSGTAGTRVVGEQTIANFLDLEAAVTAALVFGGDNGDKSVIEGSLIQEGTGSWVQARAAATARFGKSPFEKGQQFFVRAEAIHDRIKMKNKESDTGRVGSADHRGTTMLVSAGVAW